MEPKNNTGTILIIIGILAITVGFFSLFWIWPNYRVWQQGKAGEAKLREANYSRQVLE